MLEGAEPSSMFPIRISRAQAIAIFNLAVHVHTEVLLTPHPNGVIEVNGPNGARWFLDESGNRTMHPRVTP